MTTKDEVKEESSELEKLVKEKITLAKKLGIMGSDKPIPNYEKSKEYERINEIDTRLWELVK